MALPATKATTATTTHAVVHAIETYIQNQNLLGEVAELDDLLYDVIDLHKDNELALKRVLQCIYSLLQSNNKYNVKFGAKVFHKLISVVIADNTSFCRQLVANVLMCVQIYARKFPRIDGKFLLRQLWSLSLNSEGQPHAAQILVQLFDDFQRNLGEECYSSLELQLVIKSLLQSDVREYRKSAYFLMRKLVDLVHEKDSTILDTLKCSEQEWSSYITIMESLELQQSHLVLPTLGTLLPRMRESIQDEEWVSYLRILYVRLLQDNNILVLRWTLAYFLNHFDLAKLCQVNLLPEFLAATNRTQLYNVEGSFLSSFEIEKFMSLDETEEFLKALVKVSWHSVPLLFWLRSMQQENGALISNHILILKLASQVSQLRNKKLRQIASQRVLELFKETIDSLKLVDYLDFINKLFNIKDGYYNDYERLTSKLRNCENIDKTNSYLLNICCQMIVESHQVNLIVPEIIRLFNTLPRTSHECWCLFPLIYLNRLEPGVRRICCDFFSTQYNVNTDIFNEDCSLYEVENHLIDKLKCYYKEDKIFVKERCVDWFVTAKLERWSQIEELDIRPVVLLERGTEATIVRLAELLKDTDTRLEDNKNVIQAFLGKLQKHQNCEKAVEGILDYASKHLSKTEIEKLCADMLSFSNQCITEIILSNVKSLSRSLVVQGLLDGDITAGDARIEAAYINSIVSSPFHGIALRDRYICFTMQQSSEEINAISDQLLLINRQLTERKPRYFDNCKEHRLKMRIARSLLRMQDRINWSDEIWTALMTPSDQLNISFMYECLVARVLPSFEMLLEKMQLMETLKPSQQVSIISVAHLYCTLNWSILNSDHLLKIVILLVPSTMGAHFQTRLLAQLVLHKFAVKCEQTGIHLPILNALKTSIEITLGSRLLKLENETRLLLSELVFEFPSADIILYMTNAPFDEFDKTFSISKDLKARLNEYRNFLLKKKNTSNTSHEMSIEMSNLNVQRKVNPVNDIFNTNGTIVMDTPLNEKELIVVASLIDKLPNLGGLARTCEVLGAKTLTLSAKSLVDKPDFTNLSMTAEKSLNIMEVRPEALADFLIEKQSLGYKIVGAEQTAYSVSFADFKFPDKCVLLLGQEKHGISVDLIALLDFAVEIPQFGMVRSLNVHVTGSLFIWEYCKQHLNK